MVPKHPAPSTTTTTLTVPVPTVEPTAFAIPLPHINGYVDAPVAALATYLFHGELASATVTIKNESSSDLLVTLGNGLPSVVAPGASFESPLPNGDSPLLITATAIGVQSYSLVYTGASL